MGKSQQSSEVWTEGVVARRLIEAFRILPSHPVFSSRGRFSVTDDPRDASAALNWVTCFVPGREERLALLTWANCLAIGESVRSRYDALNWKRSTAEKAGGERSAASRGLKLRQAQA
jgi:hypothetical protein